MNSKTINDSLIKLCELKSSLIKNKDLMQIETYNSDLK